MAASGDDDVLGVGRAQIRHWRRPCARGQRPLPQLPAGLDVESIDRSFERASREDESSGRDDRATERDRAPARRVRYLLDTPGTGRGGTAAISPVAALTAVNVPHGGGVQGKIVLDRAAGDGPSRRVSLVVERDLEVAREPPCLPFLVQVSSRNQPHFSRDVVHRHDEQPVRAIVRHPAPCHAPDVARYDERSLQ